MDKRFIKAIFLGAALLGSSVTPVLSQGLAGPYLAANRAFEHGSFDEAARYFVKAMTADSTNLQLKQSAMISFAAAGDFQSATGIADLMRANNVSDVFVDLVALVDMANSGDYDAALSVLVAHEEHISPILWSLLSGWLKVGAGDVESGMALLTKCLK